jgi:replication factor A1
MTNVKDLQDMAKKVSIKVQIGEKSDIREIRSRFKDETYRICDATAIDANGDSMKLTLWNEQIEAVQIGDWVQIDNGYVTSFKGELQLNIGKFGKMTVVV